MRFTVRPILLSRNDGDLLAHPQRLPGPCRDRQGVGQRRSTCRLLPRGEREQLRQGRARNRLLGRPRATGKGSRSPRLLGGTRSEILSGVSLGIERDVETLFRLIDQYLAEGYRRIKLKIAPGWDVDIVRQVRERHPEVALQVDANSAYTLADLDHLKQLDAFNLLLIEQPLSHDDIIDHARLQAVLTTPVCLDESIHSAEDARKALDLQACRVINIKVSRVGGLLEAKKIHDLCFNRGVEVWCGGMHEFGIGRARERGDLEPAWLHPAR